MTQDRDAERVIAGCRFVLQLKAQQIKVMELVSEVAERLVKAFSRGEVEVFTTGKCGEFGGGVVPHTIDGHEEERRDL